MVTSNLKQRLKNGEVCVGPFFKTLNQNMVEMMGFAGYDFIIVDNEHANFGHVDIENIIRAADGVGLDSIIRIPSGSEEHVLHSLDSGAIGIQVPSLRTVEEVKAMAPHTKYYPEGHRGINTGQRAAKYGFMDGKEYFKLANENTLVVVHVENLDMAKQVDKLCAIPEVDVVFIGPADLSQSMGMPMQTSAPEVVAVIDEIIEKIKASGKIVGIWVGNEKDAARYIEKGARYLGYGSDTALLVKVLKEAGGQVANIKKLAPGV